MSSWKELGSPVALMAIVAALSANSVGGSFHYDDLHSILNNPNIRDLANVSAFFTDAKQFSVDVDKAMYRPLLLLTYALNYSLGEYDVTGYHVVNVFFHGISAILVWSIAVSLGFERHVAFLVAALFAAHPLATEPVNYISSRSELLGAALFLASFRWFIAGSESARKASVILFALGLMSKSVVVVLPVILWLCQKWLLDQRPTARIHLPYWSVVVCYLSMLAWTRFLQSSIAGSPRALDVQLWTQVKAMALYAKLLIMPVGLNVEHQFFEATNPWQAPVALGLCLVVSTSALGWCALPRPSLFWLSWMAITLAPASITPLNVLINEHRLYLPLAGFALMCGGLFSGRSPTELPAFRMFALGVVFFAGLMIQRNSVWHDEKTLWEDAAAKSPLMVRPQVHLGNALRSRGQFDAAERAYRRAIDLEPAHRAANTNLANLYLEAGQGTNDETTSRRLYEWSAERYEEVLDTDPAYKEALNNLGSVYALLGRDREAELAYRQAIDRNPHFADPYFNLGGFYSQRHRLTEAVAMYERGLALERDADAYFALGNIHAKTEQLPQAIAAYRAAWKTDDSSVAYGRNLAEVLLVHGERELGAGDGEAATRLWLEARESLERVIELDPGNEHAKKRLAQLGERLLDAVGGIGQ